MDKAYKCIGFDEFIGKEDMDVSRDNFLPSGYAKDQYDCECQSVCTGNP